MPRTTSQSQRPRLARALAVALAGAAAAPALAQGPLPAPPVPPENPITPAKRVLGKALFWEEQLSSDNTVACGTCHVPAAGGSDPRLDMGSRHPGLDGVYGGPNGADDRFASGGVLRQDATGGLVEDALFGFEPQVTGRRSPTMIGAAFFDDLFWDGRASGTFVDPETGLVSIASGGALESQSLAPILSFVEMSDEGRTWSDVRSKLERVQPLALASDITPDLAAALVASPTYPDLFADAFGDPAITAERIAYALATYERTLHPDETPWDRYQAGNTSALTGQQVQGMNAFMSTGLKCAECHTPPLFSDGSYRNLGLRDIAEDSGRQGHTGAFADRGKFKTPTLRNAGLRTRFFHNGEPTFNSLFLAVFFYNQGGGFFLDNKDPLLASIFMAPSTATTITDFLQNGLTDPRVAAEAPPFDRPTLASERGPASVEVGAGIAGSGGVTPSIVARAPAYVGSSELRVSVHGGLGGAHAALLLVSSVTGAGGTVHQPGGPSPTLGQIRLIHTTQLSPGGAGEGVATWRGRVPASPALSGVTYDFLWVARDPGAAGGQSRTATARMVIR